MTPLGPSARGPTLAHVDRAAFLRDVDALRAKLVAGLGADDLRHLATHVRASRACTLGGYGFALAAGWLLERHASTDTHTAGMSLVAAGLVLLAAALLGLGTYSAWITMHHVGHRGYDKVPGVPPRWTSRRFARGARRYLDWLDWMTPEAWIHEHNMLHHGRTGEEADPDLVERNALILRTWRAPRAVKLLAVGSAALTWKFLYYAPNTVRALHRAERARAGHRDAESDEDAARRLFDLRRPESRAELRRLLSPRSAEGRTLWLRCWLPYGALRFGVLPLPALLVGPRAWVAVFVASLLGELLTNLQGFVTITPNHTGDDLPRFEGHARDRAEFVLRQIVGSVDYTGGDGWRDFLQGYLNYQIEHHVWADLPMLKYRQAQPELEAICARHGVPYLRAPLARRFAKLVAILVGDATTPVLDTRASARAAEGAPRPGPSPARPSLEASA
jgi:fatty acid desaturase